MTIELNRRTFLALISASAATATIASPMQTSAHFQAIPTANQRCFLKNGACRIPAGPKTTAIIYLSE